MARTATVTRNTRETQITLTIDLDGTGKADLHTGIGFFDHMLDGFARHGLFDLAVQCRGDLEVDCVRRRVRICGEDVHLTQSEYRILSLLTRHAGKVLTYDYILRELWGPSAGGSNQILRVNVANIRRKIEKNPAEPKYIFTEIGVGYRMTDADAADEAEQ